MAEHPTAREPHWTVALRADDESDDVAARIGASVERIRTQLARIRDVLATASRPPAGDR